MNTAYEQIVLDAIKLNLHNRVKHKKHSKFLYAPEFAHDYCTVRLDIGRRTGKTSFIAKWASNNDLVIVHNQHMKHDFKNSAATIYTTYESRNKMNLHNYFCNIYVDNASLIDNDTIYDLYISSSHFMFQPTFVLLG